MFQGIHAVWASEPSVFLDGSGDVGTQAVSGDVGPQAVWFFPIHPHPPCITA